MGQVDVTRAAVEGVSDDALARSWLSAVHTAARCAGARVDQDSLRPPGPGWNYYRVIVLEPRGEAVRLLLNAASHAVAASRDAGVSPNGPLDFRAVPSAEVYLDAGFTVADEETLRTPLTTEHLASLTDIQRSDAEYHGAAILGDLLFNWFD